MDEPGIYAGNGMTIAVYVDGVLFFKHVENEMKIFINDLESDGFTVTREESGDDNIDDFLGIHIKESPTTVKMTQLGLIKKILTPRYVLMQCKRYAMLNNSCWYLC